MPETHSQMTPANLKMIVVAVSDLPYRVRPTWDHVRAAALAVTKRTYSRQALSAHTSIVEAYDAKVAEYRRFRTDGTTPKLVEHDEEPWQCTIANLKADKAELEAKVAELDVRVTLHIANAVRLGISTREIERPTEKPYKGATDSTTGKKRPMTAIK